MDTQSADIVDANDNGLASIISSISCEEQSCKVLKNIKLCVEYLPTFSISEVDTMVLQWVMPAMKKCVIKIFEDNFLMSDTADDEFVLDILKQNLKMALGFIQIEKQILSFILEQTDVKLKDINSVCINSAELLITTFEHCKHSSENYKTSFNIELLEIFRISQEIHSLFLKIIESCIIMEDLETTKGEVQILMQVLDMICSMSDILFDLNIKSMTNNWRGYMGITQKFSESLKDTINLKLPIQHLISEIDRNVKSLDDLDLSNMNRPTQIVRVTNFLIKIALKLFDIFWSGLEKISDDLLHFCCTVYSFPLEQFRSQELPVQFLELIESNIFNNIEPLVYRLVNDDVFKKMLSNSNIFPKELTFGFLNFLNVSLRCIIETEYNDNLILDIIVTLVFECVPLSIRLSQLCLETLINLIKKFEDLYFGINTYRLEYVHVKCLVQRIFKMLPPNAKNVVAQHFALVKETKVWKLIGLQNFSDSSCIENLCTATLDKIETIGEENFVLDDFIFIVSNFELLSTVNFNENGVNCKQLADVVANFWDFNHTDLTNNMFRYFITRICKLTARLILEFSSRQLVVILNQLKAISSDDSFRLLVCDILRSLSDKNFNDFGQEGYKIYTLMSSVLCPLLTTPTNNVIKENVLEVIETLATTGKQEIVRDIMKTSPDVQVELSNYLQRNLKKESLDRDYFTSLSNNSFHHKCVQWRIATDKPPSKKIKMDDSNKYSRGHENRPSQKADKSRSAIPLSDKPQSAIPLTSTIQSDETDDIKEVICSIKSEVKCLTNLLKKEKLSAKHVSDLKIIANQLLSLM